MIISLIAVCLLASSLADGQYIFQPTSINQYPYGYRSIQSSSNNNHYFYNHHNSVSTYSNPASSLSQADVLLLRLNQLSAEYCKVLHQYYEASAHNENSFSYCARIEEACTANPVPIVPSPIVETQNNILYDDKIFADVKKENKTTQTTNTDVNEAKRTKSVTHSSSDSNEISDFAQPKPVLPAIIDPCDPSETNDNQGQGHIILMKEEVSDNKEIIPKKNVSTSVYIKPSKDLLTLSKTMGHSDYINALLKQIPSSYLQHNFTLSNTTKMLGGTIRVVTTSVRPGPVRTIISEPCDIVDSEDNKENKEVISVKYVPQGNTEDNTKNQVSETTNLKPSSIIAIQKPQGATPVYPTSNTVTYTTNVNSMMGQPASTYYQQKFATNSMVKSSWDNLIRVNSGLPQHHIVVNGVSIPCDPPTFDANSKNDHMELVQYTSPDNNGDTTKSKSMRTPKSLNGLSPIPMFGSMSYSQNSKPTAMNHYPAYLSQNSPVTFPWGNSIRTYAAQTHPSSVFHTFNDGWAYSKSHAIEQKNREDIKQIFKNIGKKQGPIVYQY